METDRRILFTADSKYTVAKADGKPITLVGYALRWNDLSDDRGGYKVRLMPGSAKFANPSLALFHHDSKQILGNTTNGTLRIQPDQFGVKVEIDLPNTQTGRDVAALVEGGYIAGMSFAMVHAPEGRAVVENGQKIFNASSFLVNEVTVTAVPSFDQTSISLKQFGKSNVSARAVQSIELERIKLESFRPGTEIPQIA